MRERYFLRTIMMLSVLQLVHFSAVGQKIRKPWLTIEPIREERQIRLSSKSSGARVNDSSYLIIDSVQVVGNKKTRTNIILRELRLSPGDTLYADDLTATFEEKRQQLMNTSLFLSVHIYPFDTKAHHTSVSVEVLERQYFLVIPMLSLADRNFNVWWVQENHSLDRLNYGIKLYQNNMTGKNDRLSLTLQHGYTQQYILDYQLPYFDKELKQGLGVYIMYSHNREINYNSDYNKQVYLKQDYFLKEEMAFGLNYTYKKAIRLKHKVSLSYHSAKVKDTVLELNPNFFPDNKLSQHYMELSYSFSYTGTDIWTYPLQGYNINANIVRRGFGFNSKINETAVALDAAKYWTIFPKTYGEMEFVGEAHLPENQPYFLAREMGYYNNYLRGLEYFVLESDRFGILKSTLKQQVLAVKAHSRWLPSQFATVPLHVYVKVYGDLGYSYNSHPGTSMLDNKPLYTFGFGADIVTFYDAVLRVEYSFNQLHEKGLFLHFRSTF